MHLNSICHPSSLTPTPLAASRPAPPCPAGHVMTSLASKAKHVPFRNSKLTRLLEDSLSGQAKSMMFIHVAPEVGGQRRAWALPGTAAARAAACCRLAAVGVGQGRLRPCPALRHLL